MQHKLHEVSAKEFLSDAHNEHSAVCWNVCSSYYTRNGEGIVDDTKADIDATLRIQDCVRSVAIEFDAYGQDVSEEQMVKRIEKLQRMIDQLEQFKGELQEGYEKAIEFNVKGYCDE